MGSVTAIRTDIDLNASVRPVVGVDEIKRELSQRLYKEFNGTVQSGPFSGMKLLEETSWEHTTLSPVVLGCFEEELHGEIEKQINRLRKHPKPLIGVIGCAEGYYAVGLKMRLPNAEVYAVDIDAKALDICKRNATANGVEVITAVPEVAKVPNNLDLLFVDCEGHETWYLDTERWPELVGVHMIVEMHNLPNQRTDEMLFERFRGSHQITMLLEGARNPNRFQALVPLSSEQRWLAVSEGRPCLMAWYVMTPKGVYVS